MGDFTTKRCSKCKEIKPLEAFRNDRNRRDGRYPYCKACERANQKAKASTVVVAERYCPDCQQILAAKAFSKNKTTMDGLARYCKACEKVRGARFRAENQETLRRSKQLYRQTHADAVRATERRCYEAKRATYDARRAAWRQTHPDAIRNHKRHWAKANPANIRQNRMRYNARKIAAVVEPVDYAAIWERDHGICHICGLVVDLADLHYDHIIPLSKGGAHAMENIAVSHAICNLRKGAKITG